MSDDRMKEQKRKQKKLKRAGKLLFLKKKFPTEIFFLVFGKLSLRSLTGSICAAVSSFLKLIDPRSGRCLSLYGGNSLLIFRVMIT